jgi:hypothetical protein
LAHPVRPAGAGGGFNELVSLELNFSFLQPATIDASAKMANTIINFVILISF